MSSQTFVFEKDGKLSLDTTNRDTTITGYKKVDEKSIAIKTALQIYPDNEFSI